MIRRHLIPALLCASLLAACSSSRSSSSGASSTPSTSGESSSSGSLPAVAHATEMHVEPVISAGTPPPPTTLLTKDLVVGTGATAVATDTVEIQYVGANYATGKNFDSSWQRGQPATFPLNQVIPGFSQGIVGMKVGGRREMVIPPSLGYGTAGSPPAVGANETLVFVVDLLAIQ
jgi:peptidylprolyl isomerase